MTIAELLSIAKNKLSEVVLNPTLEAEILLSFALQTERSFLYAWPEKTIQEDITAQFFNLIERRAQNEPIAYIIGKKEFWSLMLTVTKDTLIPRPETELLVEFALNQFNSNDHAKIADLGTGSGAIAIALAYERPCFQIVALDCSQSALAIASKNAQKFEINNISFVEGNWFTQNLSKDFDMIISNPPYLALHEWEQYREGLRYEPKTALVSGETGLEDIEKIIGVAKNHLKQNGWLVIEHGFMQAESVRELLHRADFQAVQTYHDFADKDRFTTGRFL